MSTNRQDQQPRKSRSGSENRDRQHRVSARVTAAEKQHIEATAERIGLPVGAFLRAAALAADVLFGFTKPRSEGTSL